MLRGKKSRSTAVQSLILKALIETANRKFNKK